MSKKIERNYLEINSIQDLSEPEIYPDNCLINCVEPKDFQINKFFYKNIGKDHQWVDRLIWTDKQWIDYVSNENVKTYILKKDQNLAGFFELIFHKNKNETEIAYFGILEEYIGKGYGGFLLSEAIRLGFTNSRRIWC